MINKIKYDAQLISQAHKLFPDWRELHSAMDIGKSQLVLDMIFTKVGFIVDEDDVIKAFRNKKEQKLLDLAKRAKEIREFYQKIFVLVDKYETKRAETQGISDCV